MKKSPQHTNNRNKKTHYSFTTFLLFVFFIQLSVTSVVNITKVISYNHKYYKLISCNKEAKILQNKLKTEIDNFSAEEIARNSLKMAGKNELIVMVNGVPVPVEESKQTFEGYY